MRWVKPFHALWQVSSPDRSPKQVVGIGRRFIGRCVHRVMSSDASARHDASQERRSVDRSRCDRIKSGTWPEQPSKEIALTTLLVSLAGGAVFAQQIAPAQSPEAVIAGNDEMSALGASDIVFSNLGPASGSRYDYKNGGFSVAGRSAAGTTEVWVGLAFIPEVDVRAKVLLAPIGYISGAKLVNSRDLQRLSGGTVGTLLPGGRGQHHANAGHWRLLPISESYSAGRLVHVIGCRNHILADGKLQTT